MRGAVTAQLAMVSAVSTEARVPAPHPVRTSSAQADAGLATRARPLTTMDRQPGRPSIPPDRGLKSEGLRARHLSRSHRLFGKERHDKRRCRWWLDRRLDAPGFEHRPFSQNRERLLPPAGPSACWRPGSAAACRAGVLSDAPFPGDRTRIEAEFRQERKIWSRTTSRSRPLDTHNRMLPASVNTHRRSHRTRKFLRSEHDGVCLIKGEQQAIEPAVSLQIRELIVITWPSTTVILSRAAQCCDPLLLRYMISLDPDILSAAIASIGSAYRPGLVRRLDRSLYVR